MSPPPPITLKYRSRDVCFYMVNVTPLDAIKRKYAGSAGQAATNYREAVSRTSGWQAAAIKGQANYVAKMTDTNTLARREKAIQNKSDEDWRRGAVNQGSTRIGQGISAAADKQAQGFAPYHAALSSLSLPDRTTDPVQNIQRVVSVVQTMVNKNKEIKG